MPDSKWSALGGNKTGLGPDHADTFPIPASANQLIDFHPRVPMSSTLRLNGEGGGTEGGRWTAFLMRRRCRCFPEPQMLPVIFSFWRFKSFKNGISPCAARRGKRVIALVFGRPWDTYLCWRWMWLNSPPPLQLVN